MSQDIRGNENKEIKRKWKEYYSDWSQHYDTDVFSYGYEPTKFLPLITKEIQCGKRILDAGSGTGIATNDLIHRKPELLVSFDLAKGMCVSSKRYENHVVMGDAEQLPFGDNSFDYVLALELIEVIPNIPDMLEEFRRILRPEGLLLLTAEKIAEQKEKKSLEIAPSTVRSFTKEELVDYIEKAGFTLKKMHLIKGFFIYDIMFCIGIA